MNRRALPAAITAAVFVAAIGAPQAVSADNPEPEDSLDQHQTVQLIDDRVTNVTLADLITDPRRIHSEVLSGIAADPELLGARGELLLDLRSQLEEAVLQRDWALREQQLRSETVRQATTDLRAGRSDLASARADEEAKQARLHVMSIDAFVTNSDRPDLASLLASTTGNAPSRANELLRLDTLVQAAKEELVTQRDAASAHRERQQRLVDEAIDRLDREQGLLTVAEETSVDAEATIAAVEPRIGPAERRLERELLLRTLPGTDNLQIVAVNAYFNASQIAHQRWPNCRIAWHQLAGVGRVESFHGNFGSSTVDSGGQISPHILGPQLNGDPWLAIPDTDQGELDGDLEWDRAVGPMQFIPTSWAIFAGDGNGDGRKDPHNLYDATVAAADHLCGSGLEDPNRFRQALLGYNRSVKYGHDVMDFAERYRERADIEDPWVSELLES